MLLALTALILTPNPAQDARVPERGCIVDGLTPAQRAELSERFVNGDMPKIEEIARASAARCATQWKWSDETRDWQILHTAAYTAMFFLEAQLNGKVSQARLETLFGKLSPADQYGLTIEGGPKLDAGAYTALVQRASAMLVAEKVPVGDVGLAGNWLVAYAQFMESDAHLKAAKPAK